VFLLRDDCGQVVNGTVLGAFTFSLLISLFFNTSQEETCGTDYWRALAQDAPGRAKALVRLKNLARRV
jgi:hypothetical protein